MDMDEKTILGGEPQSAQEGGTLIQKTMYLDEVRHKDPQGTIDRLFMRKETWKRTAYKYFKEANTVKRQCNEYLKQARHWRQEFDKEIAMKQWWKFATIATGLGSVAVTSLIVSIVLFLTLMKESPVKELERQPVRVPTSGIMQQTPNHVLASVVVYNGELQGSGTIISKGDKYATLLTAGHNFRGVIGGNFWVYYVDGTYAKATLLAIDKDRDLALGRVPADTIITHAHVPKEFPKGEITSVGFTNGRGPIFKTLKYEKQFRDLTHRTLIWQFSLESGEYWNGDSGGGVFLGDALSAVATHRNYSRAYCYNGRLVQERRQMYASPYHEIVDFLKENKALLEGCGDWSEKPIIAIAAAATDAPPLWKPTPNVLIHLPEKDVRNEITNTRKEAKPEGSLKRPSDIPEPPKAIKPKYE